MATGIFGGECVANHSIYITDRGGKRRVMQLLDVSSVRWGRLRDDVSEALIMIRGSACSAQAEKLANIEPKRNEMVIYRGDERVWEGPVSRVGWHADYVEIAAKDVMDYLFARPLSKAWDNAYPNNTTVTQRIADIVAYELSNSYTYRDSVGNPVVIPGWEQLDVPINVLPFFEAHHFVNEAGTSASTEAFQMSLGEHIDNFARSGGIDYTVIGRAIHVWDVSRPLGKTRTLTEADFDGEIIVTAYGADHASVAFVVADNGQFGGSGGVATNWRFLEKTGAAGAAIALPGDAERRPSITDAGPGGWNGYRYWMAYQPTAASTMRLVGSNDGITWKDVAGANVRADVGNAVTTGDFPALSFSDDEYLWLFFIGADGHLYRTRSEDGINWTVKIDIWTPPAGLTLRSPSLYFNNTSKRWTMFGVNDDTDNLFWISSTTSNLDGPGQWGATTTAVIDGNPSMSTIEMRFIGNRWVGVGLIVGSGIRILQSKTSLASGGFAITPGNIITGGDGKPTWLQRDDGNMTAWYASTPILRTSLTGPAPAVGTGDKFMDYYGPWTKMFTVYDEDETHPPSQADLNSQAKRNLYGRSPVPIEVRIPDNSSIRLGPGLSFDQLVPGTTMPLLATLNARQMSQDQKLDKLTVTEDSSGENIQVTLVPTTKPDDDTEED